MKSWIRFLLPGLALLVLVATPVVAASTLSLWVGSGVTELTFEGVELRIETSGDVIVYLSMEDGQIVGREIRRSGATHASCRCKSFCSMSLTGYIDSR
jgi:hypothetical protein